MKTLLAVALLTVATAGCANDSGTRPTGATLASPQGTDVGTSNPGVNQPTTTTTASRSNNSPR